MEDLFRSYGVEASVRLAIPAQLAIHPRMPGLALSDRFASVFTLASKSKSGRSGRRKRSKTGSRKNKTWDIFQLKPAFPGQPVCALRVNGDPIKYTTTVTTGQIASSTNILYTLISNFTTRFATWDEYRVIRVLFRIRFFSSTNPGIVRFWIEDRSSSTPTLAIAEADRGITANASDVTREFRLDYRIMDPVYTDYTQLNATQSIGYFNVFTNNANYGSSAAATDYCVVTPQFTIQFRGFA